ncbi:zinc-binding dehydrogenase [Mycolicibacterium sp. F2034L]|uniref:zinc-dependent alcohol dehydrogenase n=1 Tax=Mycolicibacterium sp. F2034L TaxID=2926422 RepID=UPI001FF30806|nr:alcohol dehydrogenase catalytic domain-containing protein [Mycolicibacterium sp. F2034L]MCK0173927.1 alcohol dehydrogenase catalytic domain-containing protein [Mycolicibacterium sp. F2034L]
MKALVLEDFGRMTVQERRTPSPTGDEVLIEIVATGICGSDIHGYTGENGRRVPGQIMGHETVGIVAATGPAAECAEFTVGDVVTFNPVVVPAEHVAEFSGREQHCPDKYVIGVAPDVVAAFAQYVTVPARNVVRLRPDMPVEYGALIEPLAVGVHAVRRVGVDHTSTVLVIGGGPIGQSVILAARMAGARDIVVSEPDAGRRALCERLHARTIDPTTGPVPEQVRRLLGGPAAVAIDAVGIEPTVAAALESVQLGAMVCLVGMGAPQFVLPAYRVSTDERSLVGSFTYSAQDFRDAAHWVSGAPPELEELISRQVPLEDGPQAFADLARGDGTAGKVLVRLQPASGT